MSGLHKHILDRITGKVASIDSRLIKEGEVFFAINSGADFINDAIAKGASFVVEENALGVLLEYGQYTRSLSKAKIIGITGSVGKTTLKFWLSSVLGHKHKTLAGIRNYNTICGIPVCLSMLERDHEYGIFELGSNHRGEIKELAEYLKPDIAAITNIAPAHIGNFGSLEEIANEKISIVEALSAGGIVLFPIDMPYKERLASLAKSKNITAIPFEEFHVPHLPRHYHSLCGAILAIIEVLGLESDKYVPFLEELSPLRGRGEIAMYSCDNRIIEIIDDSYNASITSMEAAIDFLNSYNSKNRKVAILGEMGEAGEFSFEFHKRLAEKSQNSGISKLIFIGSADFFAIFKERGFETFEKADNETVNKILRILKDGDTVLIKGSRSVKLENIINVLQRIV
ncbi:MAG: hypothetical protein LBG13_03320 [Holosporales bacterium]|jgi:UDP-N-acetylmuramoyl-tripeptide--D-alanyl-D-alanine ligase|nr:hypothetical protein [Holosporales bacterium]